MACLEIQGVLESCPGEVSGGSWIPRGVWLWCWGHPLRVPVHSAGSVCPSGRAGEHLQGELIQMQNDMNFFLLCIPRFALFLCSSTISRAACLQAAIEAITLKKTSVLVVRKCPVLQSLGNAPLLAGCSGQEAFRWKLKFN